MKWPARLIDLNPIQNLLWILASVVYNNNRQFSSTKDLLEYVLSCLKTIPNIVLISIVESMYWLCFYLVTRDGRVNVF